MGITEWPDHFKQRRPSDDRPNPGAEMITVEFVRPMRIKAVSRSGKAIGFSELDQLVISFWLPKSQIEMPTGEDIHVAENAALACSETQTRLVGKEMIQ